MRLPSDAYNGCALRIRFALLLASCAVGTVAADQGLEVAAKAEQLLRQGNSSAALEVLAQASQRSGNSARAEDRIGFLYQVLGQGDEAVRHFRTAVAKDTRLPVAHYHLGVSLWIGELRVAALSELEEAAKLSPQTFDYRYRLGVAYLDLGDSEKAV